MNSNSSTLTPGRSLLALGLLMDFLRVHQIELHRFLKVAKDDEMTIDVLVAETDEVRRITRQCIEAESEEGSIKIASRKDLIWLKKMRGSKQDQADIEKLDDEED